MRGDSVGRPLSAFCVLPVRAPSLLGQYDPHVVWRISILSYDLATWKVAARALFALRRGSDLTIAAGFVEVRR
jgi:hypothetical protein